MKKLLVIVLTLSALLLTAVPFAAQDEAAPAEYDPTQIAWTCPEGFEGQTLNVYNWATYIGTNTVSTFEELCGVKVVYDVYDGNETLLARLRQGNPGYDIAFPTDYAIVIMQTEGLVQTIDLEKVPNIANIDPRWLNMSIDPEQEFNVPYMWGSLGVAYNTNKVSEPVTSWEQFFNHDGPVAWLGDSRSMLSIALRVLGYDANSINPDEITAAKDYLLEHSDNLVAIAADDGQALLERGEVDMVIEYGGDIFQLITDCECEDYNYVLPDEGTILNLDAMVLLTDAPNPELALVFMDYILDPYVNGQIASEIAFPTPNQAAIDGGFVRQDLLDNPSVYPVVEDNENLYFLAFIGDDDILYNDAWDELLIFVGQ
jgi:spermidine/putrescine transport system substrate-binding protein